jgi:hypothetical protein
MEELERLQKSWLDSGRFLRIHKSPNLEKRGLLFGAQTFLAKRNSDGALGIDGEETKLLTLLAVAYGRPVDLSVLNSFRAASKHTRAGDECMAAMSVALARLPRLLDPDDAARRLFIAEGLVAAGVRPQDIWKALEFDLELSNELEKLYNQNEARNPKGDGDISGRWTSETEELEEDAKYLVDDVEGVSAMAVAALTTVMLLGSTTPAGRSPTEGPIPGRTDLRFKWDPDDNQLEIFRGADPYPLLQAKPGANGEVRDKRGRKIARILDTSIQFELKGLPPAWPSPEEQQQDPQRCPNPGPDNPGRLGWRGEMDKDYADYVKAQINKPPTPRDIGFRLLNPVDGLPAVVDDCRQSTGGLVEIKGNYKEMLAVPFLKDLLGTDWVYQATRQWEASEGRRWNGISRTGKPPTTRGSFSMIASG